MHSQRVKKGVACGLRLSCDDSGLIFQVDRRDRNSVGLPLGSRCEREAEMGKIRLWVGLTVIFAGGLFLPNIGPAQ